MPDFNLDSILSGANQFMNQAVSSGNDLFDLSMRQAVSASDDANAARTIGVNNEIIDRAKTSAELATQDAKIKVANSLGTNAKAQGELLTGLSGDILGLMKEKDQALQVIRQKQSVGLLDDPLSYILNQISLPDDISKHNAINEQLVNKETNMETLNKLTQSSNLTQNQLLESVTVSAANASAQNTLLAAQMSANKSTRDALGYNAQGVQHALTISKEILATQFQAQTAITQQQNIGIALAHLDLSRQEFDWRKEEKKLADAARAKNNDADDYMMDRLNSGLQRLGMAPIPKQSPKAGNVMAMIKSGAATGSIYEEALKVANASEMADPTGNTTILAPSPSAAAELLYKVPSLKLAPAQEPIKDLLIQASANVKTAAQTPGTTINPKDPRSVSSAIDTETKRLLTAQASNIVPGDKSNVFQIPDIKTLISTSPEVQKLPVVQKIFMPAIAAGAAIDDPNTVFQMINKGIVDQTITYSEGLEATSLYQRGVKTNLEAKQFPSLGLNLTPQKAEDPSMYSYRTTLAINPRGTLFSGKRTVDMTNPFDLGRAMNEYLSKEAAVRFQTRAVTPVAPGIYEPTLQKNRPLIDTLFGPPAGTQ